jgi:hypothetical protein
MSHSLLGADRATHIKIAAIAVIGVSLVVGIGMLARTSDSETTALSGPVLKAGKPAAFTGNDVSAVR